MSRRRPVYSRVGLPQPRLHRETGPATGSGVAGPCPPWPHEVAAGERWEMSAPLCRYQSTSPTPPRMGGVEHRRRESNPRETVLETAPLPKLADRTIRILGMRNRESRPNRFPDGRLPEHDEYYVMAGSLRSSEAPVPARTTASGDRSTGTRQRTRQPDTGAASLASACSS
jgi:hypothetical protein